MLHGILFNSGKYIHNVTEPSVPFRRIMTPFNKPIAIKNALNLRLWQLTNQTTSIAWGVHIIYKVLQLQF